METEVWPNLIHEAARQRLPMVLANTVGAGFLAVLVRQFVAERRKEPSAFWDQIP